jgi:hypothetical protein
MINHSTKVEKSKVKYWLGCHKASTPRRDPTTERHGDFWLLGYPPGPVRPSLADLDTPNSTRVSISMPLLVWTSSQRGPLCNRTPNLKPSTQPDLQEAGLQECARFNEVCSRTPQPAAVRGRDRHTVRSTVATNALAAGRTLSE